MSTKFVKNNLAHTRQMFNNVVRFPSSLHKWGMATTAACVCDVENQTAEGRPHNNTVRFTLHFTVQIG